MDIVIGKIRSSDLDSSGRKPGPLYAKTGKRLRDRRENRYDRRKSVMDGIDVSFSYQINRRVQQDRRKVLV